MNDALIIAGTIALVGAAIVSGRWLDRRLGPPREPGPEPARGHLAGESAATAHVAIGAARERILTAATCLSCGGATTAGPALPVTFDGRTVDLVTLFCAACNARRAVYFQR